MAIIPIDFNNTRKKGIIPFDLSGIKKIDTSGYFKGAGYEASDKYDPYSGKPLAKVPLTIPKTYNTPEQKISVISPQRVATIFDPTKAQPLTRELVSRSPDRLPDSASQAIRTQLGAGYNEELDHQIALTLSGSNASQNLKVLPASKNQKAGVLETKLANDVIAGKISLLDAQLQDAKQKGIRLPESEPTIRQKIQNQALKLPPSVLQPLADIQNIPSAIGGFFKGMFSPKAKPVQEEYITPEAPTLDSFKGQTISQAPKVGAFDSFYGKVRDIFMSPGDTQIKAKAMNDYYTATHPDAPELSNLTKISNSIENMGALEKGMSLLVLGSVVANPAVAIPTLVEFATLDTVAKKAIGLVTSKKIDNFSDVLPTKYPQYTKDLVDVLGFIAEGYAVKGFRTKVEPKIIEGVTKNIVTEYKLPQTITIDGAKIRSAQTGSPGERLAPAEQQAFEAWLKTLPGGTMSNNIRINAIKNGLKIEVPTEKIVSIADRPWFSKIKSYLGVKPTEPTSVRNYSGATREAPAGLLSEGSTATPETTPRAEIPKVEPIPPASTPAEPIKVPNVKSFKITKNTIIEKGDMVSDPTIGRFVVSDTKRIITPTGKETVYTLKDLEGNVIEQNIKDLTGFQVEKKIGERIVSAPSNPTQGESLSSGNKSDVFDLNRVKQDVGTEVKGEVVKEVPKEVPSGITEPPKPVVGNKPSGIAKSIEAKAIEKGLTDSGYAELAGFDSSTKKLQSELGAKYTIEEHIKFATGKEPLPEGMKPATALSIAEDYAMATKDGALTRELAKSPLATQISESASALSLSKMRTPDSATAKIKEINKARAEAVKKRTKGKTPEQTKDSIKKLIKEKVAKAETKKYSKYSWQGIVDELTC